MGTYRTLIVKLTGPEIQSLRKLFRGGRHSVRLLQRARALLLLHEGHSEPVAGKSVGMSAQGVRDIGWRYCEGGLDRALYDRPRPGAEPLLDTTEQQRVIAMVCADPPEGNATHKSFTGSREREIFVSQATPAKSAINITFYLHAPQTWRPALTSRGCVALGLQCVHGGDIDAHASYEQSSQPVGQGRLGHR